MAAILSSRHRCTACRAPGCEGQDVSGSATACLAGVKFQGWGLGRSGRSRGSWGSPKRAEVANHTDEVVHKAADLALEQESPS